MESGKILEVKCDIQAERTRKGYRSLNLGCGEKKVRRTVLSLEVGVGARLKRFVTSARAKSSIIALSFSRQSR